MEHQQLEQYIQQKLSDLSKQKDMKDVYYKGKLSFGIDSTTYSRLPSWDSLIIQKKKLSKQFWAGSFFISFMALVIGGNYFSGEIATWWKDAVRILFTSAIVTLFSVAVMQFSLFVKFRETEREVRKLIYEDILFQLKEEKETV